MRSLALVLAAGCAHVAPASAPPPPDVKQLSHALLDAFDHADTAAARRLLAADFLHVESEGTPRDGDKDLAELAKRSPTAPHIVERTWRDEHVLVRGDRAMFVGRAAERSSGRRGGYTYDGRYTLTWQNVDGAWRATAWVWAPVSASAEADEWNGIFKHGGGFETAPNRLLVETLRGLAPGTALDLASGQGRNVLHEASQGWSATGIDFSHEGIEQTRAAAAQRQLAVELVEADLSTADLGVAKYDLISMLYFGADAKQIARAQAALKPGGVFVFEYFAKTADTPDGAAPGALAAQFAGYDILRDEVVEDVPDWAMERAKLQRFVARKRR